MHSIFAKHPAFWRAAAGFMVGIIFTAACVWFFFNEEWSSSSAAVVALRIIAAPVLGFMQLMSLTVSENAQGIVFPIVAFIPYSLAFCALFLFSGERQTKEVVLWEAFCVLTFLAFAIPGFANM